MPRTSEIPYAEMRRDSHVESWLADVRQNKGSQLSADVNLRRLGKFCFDTKLTPAKLVKIASGDPEELKRRSQRLTAALQADNKASSYIAKILTTVRWFLRSTGLDTDIGRVSVTHGEKIQDETIPTQAELRQLVSILPPRARVSALFMAHTGVRPITLAGLTLGSMPELNLETLEFATVPFRVNVSAKLSKIRRPYVTFGTDELAEAIRLMLSGRRGAGEELTVDSPVIASTGIGGGRGAKQPKAAGQHIATENLTFELRRGIRTIRKKGEWFRPYALRAYCATRLLVAETHVGKIPRDFREAVLGHDLGSSGRYHLGKKLSADMVEEMRTCYARAAPFLATRPQETIGREDQLTLIAQVGGASQSDIDAIRPLTVEKVAELVGRLSEQRGTSVAPTRSGEQKVVPASAVQEWMDKGWTFRSSLGPDRAVMEAAGGSSA